MIGGSKLKAQLEAQADEIASLKRQLAASAKGLSASVSERARLKALVEKLLAAEEARQKTEDARFLEDLRVKSAEAQCPIPEARMAKVAACLAAGQREIARELGESLLETSESKAQSPFAKAVKAAPKSPEDEHHKAIVAGRMALLEADGCTEVKVTKATEAETVIGFKDRRGNSGEQRLARKG